MYNSLILSWFHKFLKFLANAYKESLFNKWYTRIDAFIKKAVLNSSIIGLFITKKGKGFFERSKAYSIISGILNFAAKHGKVLGSWTKESKIVKTAEITVNQTFNQPFRIIGVFAVSFLAANISYGLILHRESKTRLILELLLLIMSLFVVNITSNFRKTLENSRFYEFFQWIIEVEK